MSFIFGRKDNKQAQADAATAAAKAQSDAAIAALSKPNPLVEELQAEDLSFLKKYRDPNLDARDLLNDPGLRGAKALFQSGSKERAADTDIGLTGDTSQGSGQMLSALRENQKNKRTEDIAGAVSGAIDQRYNDVIGQSTIPINAEASRLGTLGGISSSLYNSARHDALNYVKPPSFLEKFLLATGKGVHDAAMSAAAGG